MNRIYRIVIVSIAFLAAFFSCSLDQISINARIDNFISGLNNSNRASMYQNISVNAVNYDNVKPDTFWNTNFPYANGPYSLTGRSGAADIGGGLMQVTATLEFDLGPDPVVFRLDQINGSWFVKEYDQNGVTIID